jgi:hypothetical protein
MLGSWAHIVGEARFSLMDFTSVDLAFPLLCLRWPLVIPFGYSSRKGDTT